MDSETEISDSSLSEEAPPRTRLICAQNLYRRSQYVKLVEMFGRVDGVPAPPYAYGPDELCPRCSLQSLEDDDFEPDPFFCEVCGDGL